MQLENNGPCEPLAQPNPMTKLFGPTSEMIIVGHRGGFQPENTLHAFQQAKDNNLQAVELDVSAYRWRLFYLLQIWVTKDREIAVVHGGRSGELPKLKEDDADVYCQDLTLQQVRSHFEKTKEYADSLKLSKNVNIPTLKEVFDLLD